MTNKMFMHGKFLIYVPFFLLSTVHCFAQFPQDSRRAGGIAVIPLSEDISQVLYQQKPVLISQENGKRYAVFGIPLSATLGTLTLNTNSTPIQIDVKPYVYAEQRICYSQVEMSYLKTK